jgi:hypothetical protein
VLGTAVLSMLSGHKRYAHIMALRADGVLPGLVSHPPACAPIFSERARAPPAVAVATLFDARQS